MATYLRAVRFASDNLRTHPIWSTDHRGSFVSFSCAAELSAKAEIGQFHVAVHSEKNVVTFDVAMNDSLRMQELQGKQYLVGLN